jgi:hypothetical protein
VSTDRQIDTCIRCHKDFERDWNRSDSWINFCSKCMAETNRAERKRIEIDSEAK